MYGKDEDRFQLTCTAQPVALKSALWRQVHVELSSRDLPPSRQQCRQKSVTPHPPHTEGAYAPQKAGTTQNTSRYIKLTGCWPQLFLKTKLEAFRSQLLASVSSFIRKATRHIFVLCQFYLTFYEGWSNLQNRGSLERWEYWCTQFDCETYY